MKHLSDYMQPKQTALLRKHGAFFAFSNKQLEEAKKEGVDYLSMGNGLICPASKCQLLQLEQKEIQKEAIQEDIKDNGLYAIIERELMNYECFYSGDLTDAIIALKPYDVPSEMVEKVYRQNYSKYDI